MMNCSLTVSLQVYHVASSNANGALLVIAKCLIWDPERRLKPQPALRHPFITAGRRPKITSPAPTSSTRHLFTPSSSTSVLASARTKPLATPQKSQIGAPTPLSSRIATRAPTTTTASIPQTPTSNSHTSNLGTTASAQRYRVPASSSAYSSRTLAPASNGYAVSSITKVHWTPLSICLSFSNE